MTRLTVENIAVAVKYLQPMSSQTIVRVRTTDILDTADRLAREFPDAVHVGFGGQVSRGRLCDSLPDEVIDPEQVQVIIVEQYAPSLNAHFTRAIFEDMNPNSAVIFLATEEAMFGAWLNNHMVNVELIEETATA